MNSLILSFRFGVVLFGCVGILWVWVLWGCNSNYQVCVYVPHGIVLKSKSNHKNALSRNLWAELVLAEMNIAGFIEFSGAESDEV